MKYARMMMMGLLVAAAGMLSMGQAAQPAPPMKLAVVNIVKLFDMLDEKATADKDILKMKEEITNEVAKRKKVLEDMDGQLTNNTLFKPGSAEYKKLQDDYLEKGMQLQVYSQISQQKLFLELRVRTADLYRKMNEAIEKYAQTNGIALVFVADDLNIAGAKTQEQLQAMVTVRKIVYYHPQFDITKAIVERMNTDYRLNPATK